MNEIILTTILILYGAAAPPVRAQCSAASRPLDLSGEGQFSTPNYPSNYPDSSDCQWRITSTSQIVALSFDFFYTEACCDYVNIYDGNSLTSTQLARLYGNVSTSTVYLSTQQYMYIRFTSDSSLNYQGFTANFWSTTSGGGSTAVPTTTSTTSVAGGSSTTTTTAAPGDPCSSATQPAELTGLSGTFTSPNYPGDYNNNGDCQWRITAVYSSGTITLNFDFLNTESCCDIIYLYDGDSIKASLIASVSGAPSTPPGGFESTQQYLFVRFITDSTDTASGFSASYISTKPEDPCSPDFRPLELTGESGSFTSVNYPSNYDSNADCQWRITGVGTNAIVVLDFDDFSTESCCDIVYVYDGDSAKSQLIASVSGTPASPPTAIESTGRYMYVRFATDDTTTARGFSASFRSATGQGNPCSEDSRPQDLTGAVGTLTSLNYPDNYLNLADCQWRIHSLAAGTVVSLDFDDFSTESCCDLLYVYDGDSIKSSLIATLSGSPSQPPSGLTSTHRYMYLRFVSDPVDTDRGFSAIYRSVDAPVTSCGNILRVAPNNTAVQPGWGPVCYINSNDNSYIYTECRSLIQQLPPEIGDYESLIAQGGNFGCHPILTDDFVGSETACYANYQHSLTLASVSGATKMVVCIRLP